MSEFIPSNEPIEPVNYDPENVETAPTPVIADPSEWPEVDEELQVSEPEIISLDYGNEVDTIDPVQRELAAVIDDDTIESMLQHDKVIVQRYDEVEKYSRASAQQNEELKNDGLALGNEISTAAYQEADANRQQILEAVELMKRYAEEAGRFALAQVERKAMVKVANGEAIQQISVDFYKAATDIIHKLLNAARHGEYVQEQSVARRDLAIETKNARIEEIEKLTEQIDELQASIDISRATITNEYEPVRIDILSKSVKYTALEKNLLDAVKPTILAILNERYATDVTEDYDDPAYPEKFRDKMRAVYEELAQTDIYLTDGIQPDDVYEAFQKLNEDRTLDVRADQWFMLQRRRRMIQGQEDDIQRRIDREEAHISGAQLHIDRLTEGIAQLEEDRNYQHGLYKYEQLQEGAKLELQSMTLERITKRAYSIMDGDASAISEAAILEEFGFRGVNPEQVPEDSAPGGLIQLLKLKRRYQELVKNAQDAGENLPIMPAFVMPELPALDVDGVPSLESVIENSQKVDEMMEKMAPFKFAEQLSVDGLKATIKDMAVRVKLPGVLQRGITQVFHTKQDENEEV